jgi:adhesin/invasin
MSIHNNDQTVNFGLGYRNLINDDKVMLGVNLFLDYSFDDAHQRNGVGVEAISSVFDLRGNYYDATSGIQTLGDGSTEEALDGWDVRIDYHLPLEYDVNVFAGIFDFENAAGSFELKGEKYGLSGNAGNTNFEIGYVDDNKAGDGAFGNVTMVFDLGQPKRLSTTNGALEYVSVRDQLYTPVKRENKIRVVKVSALNIVVSGF